MSLTPYMTKDLLTVFLDDDLKKVKSVFEQHKLHHLLVVDDEGVLFGVINDRDLYKHISPSAGTAKETSKDTLLLNKKINLVMNRELITAKENLSIKEAIVLFHEKHISCLPIVDDANKPIGIITWRDIIRFLALQYKRKQQH